MFTCRNHHKVSVQAGASFDFALLTGEGHLELDRVPSTGVSGLAKRHQPRYIHVSLKFNVTKTRIN